MYRELKRLVRRCYHKRQIASAENYLKLVIRMPEKRIMLAFYVKPPPGPRRQLRLYNLRWSRKYGYWHACLNDSRLEQVLKFYKMIDNNSYDKK